MPCHRFARLLLLEEEEEEDYVERLLDGEDDVDIEAAMLLLGHPVAQNLLNPKNNYRIFLREKEWEDLQRDYPSDEEWRGAFRFKLELSQ